MQRRFSNSCGRFSALALVPFALIVWGCSGPSDAGEGDPEVAETQQELIDYTICPAGSTIVQGTAGNDVLNYSGATGPMCILGNGGNDTITGGPFDDMLIGGNGNDIINGGGGNDTVHGENGDDTIHGNDGDDYILGESGLDKIFGDNGNDYLVGADQADTISGGAGDDILYGQGDNDTLSGDDGNDKLFGGLGNDTLEGGNGDDRLQADDGDDHLWGDFINNAGSTTGSVNDTLYGGVGNDDLHGGPGDDILYGESGTDTLNGDDGDDRLVGGSGGAKTLSGGNGNDLAKGSGTGTANGDANNDVLVVAGTSDGGNGDDACTGSSCELSEPPSFCTQVAGQCGSGQRCAVEVGVCIFCQHDSECTGGKQCVPTIGCSAGEVACSDGIDNDGDSLIDCADPDCAQDANCQTGTTQVGNVGVWHECIVNSSGQTKCWGRNHCGQLGYFTTDQATTFMSPNATLISTTLTGTPKVVHGGNSHTCVLLTNGGVQCWGRNVEGELGMGQLGTGTSTAPQCTGTAQTVKDSAGSGTLAGVTQLAGGGNTNCALLNDGTIQCWGQNNFGQLGNNSTTNSALPVAVQGLGGTAVEVKVGTQAACARLTSGVVKCWGRNHYGQLGNNSTANSKTAVTVAGLGSVAEIGVGGEFACARRSNGSIACWGANYAGQLGLGTNDNNKPHNATTVPTAAGATNLSLGWYHACIVRGTGQTMCWGMNDLGQLGFGSTSSFRATPANLAGINDGSAFGMGAKFTCLRRKSGNLTCWGDNQFGQIGNGTSTSPVLSPFTVTGVP